MSWYLWVLIIFVLLGPIGCSMFVCVPSWYREKVAPSTVGRGLSRVRSFFQKNAFSTGYKLGYLLDRLFVGIACCIALPIIIWVDAWRVLITRACPYTSPSDDGPALHFYNEVKRYFSSDELEENGNV